MNLIETRDGLLVPAGVDLPLPEADPSALHYGRRHFLSQMGALVCGSALCASSYAHDFDVDVEPTQAEPVTRTVMRTVTRNAGYYKEPDIPRWPGANEDRQVWLTRKATGESIVARYFNGAGINMRDYVSCCHILRDVQANKVVQIDVRLLDLLFAMQKWLVSWGIDRPLTIMSGYRTLYTNNKTEGASRQSMHLRARAADVAMDGVPAAYLARLAAVFGQGGVGFYMGGGFVHVDVGRARYWTKR